MKRQKYYNYIEERLNTLCTRINKNGKLNHLELHLHSEYFYRDFFNKLYKWNLYNENDKIRNVEAIDLIDDANKYIVQVSATNTKDKIESSLRKKSLQNYSRYTFKFISISKDADVLRGLSYVNPYGLKFIPTEDIIDSSSILSDILTVDVNSMEMIYQFIKTELGGEVDVVKLDSNLAKVINILAKENLVSTEKPTINYFEIDRKIEFNNLKDSKAIINDYSTHYGRVDRIYNVFDTQGSNVSISVLEKIRDFYTKNKKTESDDELFSLVVKKVVDFVTDSSNCGEIPIDEIELCVKILVVDAFIRCKIFENPIKYNYNYATT